MYVEWQNAFGSGSVAPWGSASDICGNREAVKESFALAGAEEIGGAILKAPSPIVVPPSSRRRTRSTRNHPARAPHQRPTISTLESRNKRSPGSSSQTSPRTYGIAFFQLRRRRCPARHCLPTSAANSYPLYAFPPCPTYPIQRRLRRPLAGHHAHPVY